MLTQKKIKSVVPSSEFSKEMISWLSNDADRLAATFKKKFPRAKNTFNVQLKNVKGSPRILAFNSKGEVKFFRTDSPKKYKNVISWQIARVLGCPAS